MPLDHSALLSDAARKRPKSVIRELLVMEKRPGMISMLAGKPNPEGFPFSSITMDIKLTGQSEPVKLTMDSDLLNESLQYSLTPGINALLDAYARIIARVHGRTIDDGSAAGDFALSSGVGSQDLITKAFGVVLNPGETVLTEAPLYTGVLPSLTALEANVVGVDTDKEGLSARALEAKLASWKTDPATASLPFPKILYTVPAGSNPAGTTASVERKREVLAIVRRYGILLFEDDPYYYLAFDGLGEDPVSRPRIPSYFALEREGDDYGYVIRFESLSKIISAGLRLGFVYGPRTIVRTIDVVTASTNLHPSGISQAATATLLDYWGVDGFLRHVDSVSAMYKERRDMFASYAEKHLGSGGGQQPLAKWVLPVAGMFFWFKLHLPPTENAPEGDSSDLMLKKAADGGVLLVPGAAFFPTPGPVPYARASFSLIEPADVDEGLRRLRAVIEEAWHSAGYDSIPPI
ncbi:tryptophan transaminase [Malassezia cuniculi]|uniref:Tryptophan transaminase n=1 Tax=Malassezia cuniculi TaxID=948313 RepID=A0AAF0EMP9_9BASI|nr:tryptophan transaminase [Malassezia cuniculi]